MSKYSIMILVSIIFSVSTVSDTALGADESAVNNVPVVLPDEAVDALKKNAADISTISLSWKRGRTTTLDFEKLIKQTKCLYDCGFLEPVYSVFMWQNGHSYLCYIDKNAVLAEEMPLAYEVKAKNLELMENISERSFDGEMCYIGSGHEHSELNTPVLVVYSAEQAKEKLPNVTICYPEYLTCAGYRFPLDAPELREAHDSFVLYLANRGKLIKVRNDKGSDPTLFVELIAKETWTKKDHRYKFWLSPKLNFAVVKYEVETLEGRKAYQIDNSDFYRIPGKDIFIPRKSVQKCFTFMTIPGEIYDSPLFEDEFHLADVSTNKINEKQFDLRNKYTVPGTMIGNHVFSKDSTDGIHYALPANPADLERVIEAALTGKDFTPTPMPSRYAIFFRWILVFAGVGLVGYVLFAKFVRKSV